MMIRGEQNRCGLLSGLWAVICIYKYGGPGRLIEETSVLSLWNTRWFVIDCGSILYWGGWHFTRGANNLVPCEGAHRYQS